MKKISAYFMVFSLLVGFGLLMPHQGIQAATQQSQRAKVLDISVQSVNGRISAAITFSDPVQGDVNLDQWLSIERDTGEKITGAWVLDDKAKMLYFTNIEPEHSYRVRVEKGLPFANKQVLMQGKRANLDIDPISPMLGFAGNGNLLADSLTDGLPVISVNINQVDVDFYRIPQDILSSFLTRNNRQGQQDFWQVESYIDQLELVYTGRFDLNLANNQTATSYLPVKDIAPLQQQGVYLAIMRKSGSYQYSHPSTWFAVSDLGIHLRVYPEQADVSINSLATALPMAGVKLELLDDNGKVIDQMISDRQGAASFSKSSIDKASLLLASKDKHTSVVRLFGATLDLSEFPISGPENKAQRLFFYSPRDLYRPGESVTVSALLRNYDGKLMPEQVITFKLKQPDGRVASEQRLRANELGYYASQWQLPTDAPTGQWLVSAYIAGKKHTSYELQVEDFLPERMELELLAPEFSALTDALSVEVNGQYLYGAPAADNILQTQLVTNTAAHPFKNFKDYYFAKPQITEFNRRTTLEDQNLNDRGELEITAENFWQSAKTPMQLKVYASLLDSGGRPVSRAVSNYALPADQLVGIRPLFADDSAPYDSNANFEIILTDGERKLAAQNLSVKLVREQRNYHWFYNSSSGWMSDYTERHYSVSEQQVAVKADGFASVSLPVEWGHYRLEVTNADNQLVTGYKFRAGWSADETVMSGRPDRIGLALDKQNYQVNDTVNVAIKAPAAGKGYLLVESATALYRQPIDIPAQGANVSFVVQDNWDSHDLYVSVLLIQPGNDRAEKLPRRMMGIAPLPLNRESRKLNISLDAPQKIRPNSQLRIPVNITVGEQEQPIAANSSVQVTLAAVDVGVLNISRFATPDPFAGFFQQRAYSVLSRDSYSDLIDAQDGVMASLKFGGDSDTGQGGEMDSDVQIVSLFSAVVDVDSAGNAEVVLDIPDFNGRIRLMATAFSADSFGAQDAEVEVADPIVAQLTKARFLRAGDKSQLALDLNNLSGAPQQVELAMTLASGLSFDEQKGDAKNSAQQRKMTIDLAKGQRKTMHLPITAGGDYQSVAIDLALSNIKIDSAKEGGSASETITIARHWQLTIKPAWAITNKQWQAVLPAKEQFKLDKKALSTLLTQNMSGQLNVASHPPLDIANHLTQLEAYPYGCLEQTTSGVFPQLYINDELLATLGLQGSDAEQRRKAVNLAIQRLQGMQRSDGSFGLWSDQSPEEHWLGVYVLDFLLRAKEAGYQVPEDNLAKTLQRVAIYLRNPNKISSYYESVNDVTKFAVRAYAGQVLARYNQAPLSVLRRLYDNHSSQDSPMALLQLGIALSSAGDSQRSAKALNKALAAINDFGKADIYYSSPVRDLALSAFWLIEQKIEIKRWQPLLFSLTKELTQRQWLSTQERNALFLLGKELQKSTGDNMHLAWSINKQGFDEQLKRLQLSLSSEDLLQDITLTNKGSDAVYMNLRASGYERKAPKALDNGLSVKRQYYQLNGDAFNGTEIVSGEKLIVGLTVEASSHLRHALLVDLLPAGLEIENQNLADAYDQSDLQVGGRSISDLMYNLNIATQEYRDDRFVMAIDLPDSYQVEVFYLVRAVSPGIFAIPPTFAEDMYRPQIRHQGKDAGTLTILPR
ncbi:alpha-2-macroglobulin [Gammaproteobacteria bacterium AS21]